MEINRAGEREQKIGDVTVRFMIRALLLLCVLLTGAIPLIHTQLEIGLRCDMGV